MAERTGLEPATPGVTGRYSNQLNYRSGPEPRILAESDSASTVLLGYAYVTLSL